MNKNKISFVSTRKRNFNIDLRLIKDYLMTTLPQTSFDYFLSSTATDNIYTNRKIEDARRDFCTQATHIICMDPSIPIKLPSASEKQIRILLSIPYEYQFDSFLDYKAHPKKKKKKTFIRCTHIIPGSPFGSRLLKNFYEWEDNVTFLDGICLPTAWDLLQEEHKLASFEKLSRSFPAMEGKKILAIILPGQTDDIHKNPFKEFPLHKLLDAIKDDWFLITNSCDLLEIAHQLSFEYKDSFGYVETKEFTDLLLYTADMLITNNSRYASIFSITKKPIYYLNYLKKFFGNYIKQYYPSMYLETINELLHIDFSKSELSEEQEKFCQEFSFNSTENPFELIKELFL